MIMSWAAGEATDRERTRSSVAVDRMDENIESIVQKYCRKDDGRNKSRVEQGTRYRTLANATTIEGSQERSRYM